MPVRKLIFITIGFGIIIAAFAGCAYSKKDIVAAPCVIGDSTFYTKDVVPILQVNCYRCHSAASNSSGVLLDNYSALQFYAQNGTLYGNIAHLSGYNPMPADGGKLSDCNIAIIKEWIDKGTPQ